MKRQVNLGDGRTVTVVGTAHVSEESRREVSDTVEEVDPDLVAVELDEKRYRSMTEEDGWKDVDIIEAVKDGKGYLLFAQLVMSIYQRKLGMEKGIDPGAEMLEAVEKAEENGVKHVLVDRELDETLERLRAELSLWEKFKLLATFWAETGEEIDVEDLKDTTLISSIVEELEDEFPSINRILLEERNSYMVEKLLEEDFEDAVLVVGAAHVEGVVDLLEDRSRKFTHEEPLSAGLPWFKMINYGLPLVVLAMFGYAFFEIGFSTGLQATGFWIGVNAFLSMLGAVAARAHLVTWITAFVSAPLTSLYPGIGAGMVSAYVEGRLYPPTVRELEDIVYIEGYRDLWGNQVGRIILTLVLVSFTGAIGTLLGATYLGGLIALV